MHALGIREAAPACLRRAEGDLRLAVARSDAGKGASRRLRAQGRVPAVLYGHGMEPVHLSVDARELYRLLHTGGANVLIDLHVNKDKHLTLAREIQRDNVKGQLVHVDFLAIRRDEKITVDIPVRLVGESRGVKEGGVTEHHLWEIKATCLPADVPESVEADITPLGIGENLHVRDLRAPSGVEFLSSEDEIVVSVVTPQILKAMEELEAAEAEAAAEAAAEAGEAVPEGEAAAEGAEPQEGGEG